MLSVESFAVSAHPVPSASWSATCASSGSAAIHFTNDLRSISVPSIPRSLSFGPFLLLLLWRMTVANSNKGDLFGIDHAEIVVLLHRCPGGKHAFEEGLVNVVHLAEVLYIAQVHS